MMKLRREPRVSIEGCGWSGEQYDKIRCMEILEALDKSSD